MAMSYKRATVAVVVELNPTVAMSRLCLVFASKHLTRRFSFCSVPLVLPRRPSSQPSGSPFPPSTWAVSVLLVLQWRAVYYTLAEISACSRSRFSDQTYKCSVLTNPASLDAFASVASCSRMTVLLRSRDEYGRTAPDSP